MKDENSIVDAEVIASSIKSGKVVSVQQLDAYVAHINAVGKLPELGKEYLSLLKESLKTHDDYQNQLLLQFNKIQDALLSPELTDNQQNNIKEMFHILHKELENIRISQDEVGRHIRNWAGVITLAIIGAVVTVASGGRIQGDKIFKA